MMTSKYDSLRAMREARFAEREKAAEIGVKKTKPTTRGRTKARAAPSRKLTLKPKLKGK